nr:putative ribonuclease H-like domain-containing protein [Tanacetum cinerariifolium]
RDDEVENKSVQRIQNEESGRLKYFLGIEVLRSKQRIFICQKKYVIELLAETGMIDRKPMDTPMMVNQKLYMEEKAKLADKGRYQRIVGKLIYLSHTHWAGDKGNRRSTSGYFTLVGGNLVTWRSKKQKVVALSSAEAEF